MLSAAFIALISISVASATKSLSVVTSAPASLTDVSDLEVITTVTNTGDEALNLLADPRTVLSSWATQSFIITGENGAQPDFDGVAVRYVPELIAKTEAKKTIALAPGESVDVAHEVGNFYNFTSAGEGLFTVTPLATFQALEEDGTLTNIEADAIPTTVSLTGRLASNKALKASSIGGAEGRRTAPASGLAKRASYRSCTADRQAANNAAITAGASLATRSLTHLNNNPSGSSIQTTWYGAFSASHRSGSISSFTALSTAPASWTYDCTCTDPNLYAYVYPNAYGVVYLCGYYWNAPATGSGSRADTIIHEGTHFTRVLGTRDYAYGESRCRALAASNADQAYGNADNHAFFSAYA